MSIFRTCGRPLRGPPKRDMSILGHRVWALGPYVRWPRLGEGMSTNQLNRGPDAVLQSELAELNGGTVRALAGPQG